MKLKSPPIERLPGILVAGLVALAVGAAGAAPATAATGADASGATISGLTKKQQKQKKKALKKCNKKKARKCKKQVNNKYKKIARNNTGSTPTGATKTVKLGDDYFVPGQVDLKVNDAIKWSWADIGGFEPHNVTLVTGPSGVSRGDFASQTTADKGYSFKRTFTKAGNYDFVCSLHTLMTMQVNVYN